jgi:hypothetical protein
VEVVARRSEVAVLDVEDDQLSPQVEPPDQVLHFFGQRQGLARKLNAFLEAVRAERE